MFHATNFTESSNAVLPLEKLMKTALDLWSKLPYFKIDPKLATPEDFSDVATKLADQHFVNIFGKERSQDFADDRPEEVTAWMLHATCCQWFGLWGDLAFPRIQASHSFAAMLMATTISQKEIAHVEAPWPAFLVEVPEGLLPIRLRDNKVTYITRIHVTSHFLPRTMPNQRWWSFWMTGNGVEVLRVGPLDEMVIPRSKKVVERTELKQITESPRIDPRDQPLDDDGSFEDFWEGYDRSQEERVAVLAGRLVVGACIAMTDRANYEERPVKIEPQVANFAKRISKQPISRVFKIGQPVKIDFKPAVQSYIEGERGTLSVQSLVAGHHKRQPHGPNSADRKWIFVKPYWRGPEDAAIVVRPHQD